MANKKNTQTRTHFDYTQCKVISGVTPPKVSRGPRSPSKGSLIFRLTALKPKQALVIPLAGRDIASVKSGIYTASRKAEVKVQPVFNETEDAVYVYRKAA